MQLRHSSNAAHSRVRYLERSTEDPLSQDAPNVVANLRRSPKRISSIYVYDRVGTELFERQCGTPEYYLRRVESELLHRHAAEIIGLCGFLPMVELGAGTAEKTRVLLEQYPKHGMRCDYFPIDVDAETLVDAAHRLVGAFPTLFVHCLAATYQRGLCALPPCPQSRLFMFLGSSLGNMELQEIDALLSQLFGAGVRDDLLLLGVDLDKDPAIIDRAYNDSMGYGARSTLNMLPHLNRRYGGDFVMDNFRYRSKYNPQAKRNEVQIESLVNQTVKFASLGVQVSFEAAELIDAEVMWKFDPDELRARLDGAGFSMVSQWIQPQYRYGLFLLRHR